MNISHCVRNQPTISRPCTAFVTANGEAFNAEAMNATKQFGVVRRQAKSQAIDFRQFRHTEESVDPASDRRVDSGVVFENNPEMGGKCPIVSQTA